MSTTLRTPGYDSIGWSARPLTSGEHLAMFLGAAAGESVEVLWGLHVSAPTGWTELAIAVRETPALGNVRVRYVGAVDITVEAGTYVAGPVRSLIPVSGVKDGDELYLIVATWSPPGMGSPVLIGPTWADPIGSGLIGVIGGDVGQTRPSGLMAVGQAEQTFAVVPWTHGVSAVAAVT